MSSLWVHPSSNNSPVSGVRASQIRPYLGPSSDLASPEIPKEAKKDKNKPSPSSAAREARVERILLGGCPTFFTPKTVIKAAREAAKSEVKCEKKCEIVFKERLAANSDNLEAFCGYARLFLSDEAPEGVLKYCSLLLNYKPADLETEKFLKDIQKKALKDCIKLLRRDPKNTEAQALLRRIQNDLNDLKPPEPQQNRRLFFCCG